MSTRSLRLGVLAIVALAFASGCSEPIPTQSASSSNDLLNLSGLSLLSCPQGSSYSATKKFGPAGGQMAIGPHLLVVPANALHDTVTISATSPAGSYRSVQFQPQGFHFDKQVSVQLSYKGCGLLSPYLLKVVYVAPDLSILETLLSVPDLFNQRIEGSTNHFSSYMLAH